MRLKKGETYWKPWVLTCLTCRFPATCSLHPSLGCLRGSLHSKNWNVSKASSLRGKSGQESGGIRSIGSVANSDRTVRFWFVSGFQPSKRDVLGYTPENLTKNRRLAHPNIIYLVTNLSRYIPLYPILRS